MKTNIILLIEDDQTLASTIAYNLEQQHWQVLCAHTFADAIPYLKEDSHDLTILDVNLPDGSGFTLCENYRMVSEKPVIFLTANDLETAELQGYDAGADDYITKPFSLKVLIKKIEVLLKRTAPSTTADYTDDFLTVNFDTVTITCGSKEVTLSALEFRTLKLFIENAGIVLTRQTLLEKLWDIEENYVDEHALTMGISRLRKKIEHQDRKYISTIYGLGYMWVGKK